MLLSAVSVLVVAQSSAEFPEGFMNNPVFKYCSILDSSTLNEARRLKDSSVPGRNKTDRCILVSNTVWSSAVVSCVCEYRVFVVLSLAR